jgi:isocitrate dehydrogenase (NAD+)
MLSATMLLVHLGENAAAHKLQTAIEAVYRENKSLTGDVGGAASTEEFTDAVVKAIKG